MLMEIDAEDDSTALHRLNTPVGLRRDVFDRDMQNLRYGKRKAESGKFRDWVNGQLEENTNVGLPE